MKTNLPPGEVETNVARDAVKRLIDQVAPHRLPVLVVVGLPSTGSFVSLAGNLDHPQNLQGIAQALQRVMKEQTDKLSRHG